MSGSYFSVLGVQPQLGRLIDPSDDVQPGRPPGGGARAHYWQNQLASDPTVIGRNVSVNGYPMTVIGIAPASFTGIDPLVAGRAVDAGDDGRAGRQHRCVLESPARIAAPRGSMCSDASSRV